jgi:hypothetical protein
MSTAVGIGVAVGVETSHQKNTRQPAVIAMAWKKVFMNPIRKVEIASSRLRWRWPEDSSKTAGLPCPWYCVTLVWVDDLRRTFAGTKL